MSKIYGNCKNCKKSFEVNILSVQNNDGYFECPNCKKRFYRFYNQKEETYQIVEYITDFKTKNQNDR